MLSNRFIAVTALALSLAVAPVTFAGASCPAAGSLSYAVSLTGSQSGGTGSPTGFGNGYVTFDPQTNQAQVTLRTTGLAGTITGAGFYGTGGSGSSIFTFTDPDNMFGTDGTFERNVTLSPALFNQILANPSNYSIGIATGEYPNGAITGTLVPLQTFGGTFSGSSIVGTAGATNAGGSFTAQIVPATEGSGSTLYFTFTPTGIGTSFTSLELRQGLAGTNGSVFATLAGSGTVTNGSYSGSTELTVAHAQQVMANPSNFYFIANNLEFSSGAIRSQFAAVRNEYFIPVAGTVRGATGNRWQTDLLVTNLSTATPVTVTVQMFTGGQSNVLGNGGMNAVATGAFTVPAGGVSSLDNALQTLFIISNGVGGLRITSDHPIIVGAQIYDANQSSSNDTAQTIDGLTRCDALTRGILTVRGAGANRNGNPFRSNVGFFNPNGVPVPVTFTIRDEQGAAAGGTPTLTIPAYGQLQMPMMATNGLFPNATVNGSGTITFRASAPIFAYSAVVHAVNGDTHLTMAHEDVSMPTISQADVASIMTALNQGEINVNSAALQRLTSSAARTFAQRMVAEHTAALAQAQQIFGQAGIIPANNATATFITNMAEQTVASLNNNAGAQFDRAYVQSQVTMHQVALTTLDMLLIPSASNAQLQSFLHGRRAAVAQHLAEAKQLLLSV